MFVADNLLAVVTPDYLTFLRAFVAVAAPGALVLVTCWFLVP